MTAKRLTVDAFHSSRLELWRRLTCASWKFQRGLIRVTLVIILLWSEIYCQLRFYVCTCLFLLDQKKLEIRGIQRAYSVNEPSQTTLQRTIHSTASDAANTQVKDVPTSTRFAVALFLAARVSSGVLPKGSIKAAMAAFTLSRRTVYTIWRKRKNTESLIAPRKRREQPLRSSLLPRLPFVCK